MIVTVVLNPNFGPLLWSLKTPVWVVNSELNCAVVNNIRSKGLFKQSDWTLFPESSSYDELVSMIKNQHEDWSEIHLVRRF